MLNESEWSLFLHVRPSAGENPPSTGQSGGGLLESCNIRPPLPRADLQFLPCHPEGLADANSARKIPLKSCLIPPVKLIIPTCESSVDIYYATLHIVAFARCVYFPLLQCFPNFIFREGNMLYIEI